MRPSVAEPQDKRNFLANQQIKRDRRIGMPWGMPIVMAGKAKGVRRINCPVQQARRLPETSR